jgi:hypothetical protein
VIVGKSAHLPVAGVALTIHTMADASRANLV